MPFDDFEEPQQSALPEPPARDALDDVFDEVRKAVPGSPDIPGLLSAASKKHGVRLELLNRMVRKEDATLDPKAVSPAGAMGIMQLMPKTAKELMGEKGDPFDPEQNVDAGTRYIKQLLDKYNG